MHRDCTDEVHVNGKINFQQNTRAVLSHDTHTQRNNMTIPLTRATLLLAIFMC